MAILAQTCKQCGCKPDAWVNACPRCANVFESPERVRKTGWLALIAGGFLVVMMSVLLVMMGGLIQPTMPGATPLEPAFVGRLYFMLGLVLVLGLVALASGTWQVRHGTRNRRLVGTLLVLVMMFMGAMISTVMSIQP